MIQIEPHLLDLELVVLRELICHGLDPVEVLRAFSLEGFLVGPQEEQEMAAVQDLRVVAQVVEERFDRFAVQLSFSHLLYALLRVLVFQASGKPFEVLASPLDYPVLGTGLDNELPEAGKNCLLDVHDSA